LKISVITVAWNAAATIGDTLRSVAAQTGVDVEHIIIDGGSLDASAEIVADHAGSGAIFISEPDKGLYDAMNKGVARATGDVVGFLNADDFFCRTDALALIAAAMHGSKADAVSGSVAIVRASDMNKLVRAYSSTSFAPWMLRFGHMPPHPGFYVRRSVFETVGSFDPAITIGADFDWMLRFFRREHLVVTAIPQTLVTFRDGGLSNDGFSSRRRINAQALASLRRNRILSSILLVWSKYLLKAIQLVGPANQWPAPLPVRYEPLSS
jgi:glycosyltransferase involved in cell wall biosynthesis